MLPLACVALGLTHLDYFWPLVPQLRSENDSTALPVKDAKEIKAFMLALLASTCHICC